MTTERIAQTFPDINSQGLNTSGTAAGVRSFPDTFVAAATSSGVLVQRGVINVAAGSLTGTLALGTPVDVTRSFINYRGQNVVTSTTAFARWRNHLSFTGIVGSLSSTVLATRGVIGTELNIHLTVFTYTGGPGGTSIDMEAADVGPTGGGIADPEDFTIGSGANFKTVLVRNALGNFFSLGTPDPSNAFVVLRGISVEEIQTDINVPAPTSRFHPEQWHGSLEIDVRGTGGAPPGPGPLPNPPVGAAVTFRRDDRGNSNVGGCGRTEVLVYATLVWFPPPGPPDV
jgi:hypothetical protein